MAYELCQFPPTLFKDVEIFYKANKPTLAKALRDFSEENVLDSPPKTEHYVLDGGSLIFRMQWKIGDTYGSIARSCAKFTARCYGKATVVFDGYNDGPSIKDNAHQQRRRNKTPPVEISAETKFEGKSENFLSEPRNKHEFIYHVANELQKLKCNVIQAEGDADVDIVRAAIEKAKTQSTTLIGEDTDLLILLLHYADENSKDLYFRSDKKLKNKEENGNKVYNITGMKKDLGSVLCSQLLFIHAFTGCDTTSQIHRLTKESAFRKFLDDDSILQECACAFLNPSTNQDDIETYGNKAMVVMFQGNFNDSLTTLRCNYLRKRHSTKSHVTLKLMPPTQSSTKYHSFRAYYQIMVWIGKEKDLKEKDWGWKRENNNFVPVMSDTIGMPDYFSIN